MSEKKNFSKNLLSIIFQILIIISLIFVFLEDFFLYIGADSQIIFIIKFSNFYIDILFSVEFIVKMFVNLSKKNGTNYFVHKNGWADMFASIPLLLFISIPFFLKDVLNINFPIVSIEYLISLRILRFFRILKFIGSVENLKSMMVKRHLSIINLLVSTSIILFFFIISFLQDIDILDSTYKKIRLKEIDISKNYLILKDILSEDKFKETLKSSLINFSEIVLVKYNDDIYYNYDINDFQRNRKYLYYEDYVTQNQFQIVFLRKNFYSEIGFNSIIYFCLIFFVIFGLSLLYKNYFTLNILKPILTMKKGFEDINYIKEVNIPQNYKNDEIFVLSNNYNLRWLEAKKRKLKELKIKGLTIKN